MLFDFCKGLHLCIQCLDLLSTSCQPVSFVQEVRERQIVKSHRVWTLHSQPPWQIVKAFKRLRQRREDHASRACRSVRTYVWVGPSLGLLKQSMY